EILLPHDFMDIAVVLELMKHLEENPNNPQLRARLEPLLKGGQAAAPATGTDAEKVAAMDAYIRRSTGVSDDLFGRWLQDLAGRQVVVLLDSCFSGGF